MTWVQEHCLDDSARASISVFHFIFTLSSPFFLADILLYKQFHLQEKTQSGARKKKCIYRRCLVMFNIQPHVPGTKPLTLQVGEGPKKSKKDEANDKEGRDTSSAPSTSAATLSVVKNKIQVDDETEESTEIAAKDKTAMDVSHHEDRCFACKDGGGKLISYHF